jgi:hypothetical protein
MNIRIILAVTALILLATTPSFAQQERHAVCESLGPARLQWPHQVTEAERARSQDREMCELRLRIQELEKALRK